MSFHRLLPFRHICLRCARQSSSTATPSAPPLLLKIRADMKSALKARDTNRLNILRALLADSTNAAKSSKPVTTDLHVLALLKKRAAASRSASAEFGAANRGDLQETEDQQRGVLEEYMAGVETVGAEEVRRVVVEVVDGLKKEGGKFGVGEVIGRVVGKGGVLEDKNVDRGEVARVVKEVVTA